MTVNRYEMRTPDRKMPKGARGISQESFSEVFPADMGGRFVNFLVSPPIGDQELKIGCRPKNRTQVRKSFGALF